jgi:uncharacterized phage protein (TIGR02218 family)
VTYAGRETSAYGGAPVELYRFTCGGLTWSWTSGDVEQTALGLTFMPAPISRGEVDTSDEDTQGSLELVVPRTNQVAGLFIADLPPEPVMLEVYRLHRGDAEIVLFWSGEIASAEFVGSAVRLAGIPVSRVLRRQLPPHTFQGQCNWALYSPQCGVNKLTYRITATVTAISGFTISATEFDAQPDDYFRAGWVETVTGEKHWVTAHVGAVVTLLTPFRSLAIGDVVYAFPGCDRTIAACKSFSNLPRHLGFAFVPTKNPFRTGVV